MSTIQEKKISTKSHKNYHMMIERYESVQEIVKHCKERTITSSSFDDKSKERFGSWEGVKTYEEALDLLNNGYQPTVDSLNKAIRINQYGNGKRITFKNDICGFAPIVPLALKGVPQSMINVHMKPIKCKVIDVYYDMTTSSSTDSETIIENGQKLLGAIVALEQQGYRFNLYAVQTYSNEKDADVLVVKIKSSSASIDLKKMSFPLTHTAFFRVIGFDWYSKTPKGKYRSAYGRALAYTFDQDELDIAAKQMFGDNALFISGNRIQKQKEGYIKEVLTNGNESKDR